MNGRAAWWPAGILAAGCLLNLSTQAQRTMPLAQPLSILPMTLERHQGADLPVDPEEAKIAGATASLHRVYTVDSTSTFSIYVGYYASQRQGTTIHSPKNCLPGAGWEPLESRREIVAGGQGEPIQVNRFVIAKRNQQALVYYWYQGRGRTESNEYRVKIDLVRDAALRRRSEEALVRVVVPMGQNPAAADTLARRVLVRLHHELKGILPS